MDRIAALPGRLDNRLMDSNPTRFRNFPWFRLAVIAVCIAVPAATAPLWWGPVRGIVEGAVAAARGHNADEASRPGNDHKDSHAGHDHTGHDHTGHDHEEDEHAANALPLSRQARLNLGLTPDYLQPVRLQTYTRTVSIPAAVVPVPGRTRLQVSSPLSGIVNHVHRTEGEAVTTGELLFQVRLTHEELVESQTHYLRLISELAVEEREIQRLASATQSGAIATKTLLERRYAKEKLEAAIAAQREALKLHGLSDRQIDAIAASGLLLRDLDIVAPDIDRHTEDEELRLSGPASAGRRLVSLARDEQEVPLVIDELYIQKGQGVAAGETLCSLSDYSRLYVEAAAFPQDAQYLQRAVRNGESVEVIFGELGDGEAEVRSLKIAFVANEVDPATRTLPFYVELPNEVLHKETDDAGRQYVTWKYRIGQRPQVRIPVERWEGQIVLPVEAVAFEGPDAYVFRLHGPHVDRTPVRVLHRDRQSAVIADDGSLRLHSIVAMRGAHQMQMAMKNRAGGGSDPHAGHSH